MAAQSDNRTCTSRYDLTVLALNTTSVLSGGGTFPSSSGGGASIVLQSNREILEADAWQFLLSACVRNALPISKWSTPELSPNCHRW